MFAGMPGEIQPTGYPSIRNGIEHFIHQETASGMLQFTCTILALGIANSTLAGHYHQLFDLVLPSEWVPGRSARPCTTVSTMS